MYIAHYLLSEMKKIKKLSELIKICSDQKSRRKKVVLCHGVFDLLHLGHIKHFQKARNFGDILIVSITSSKFVNKIPGRPFFSDIQRQEALQSIQYIDYVFCNKDYTPINLIKKIKPNFYCKGPDYKDNSKDLTGNIKKEINAVKSINGKIVITDDLTFSSSQLINEFSNEFNSEQKKFLSKIKKITTFELIEKSFKKLENIKTLIIGESIVDEYIFCEGLGKSGKESVLSLRERRSEKYLGGILSMAQNSSSFAKKITALSYLGEDKVLNSFIKKKLNKKIKFNYVYKNNAPTILKKRLLDVVDNRKLIGIYNLNDDFLSKDEERAFLNKIKKEIKKSDLVIVADFGHGLITKKIAKYINGIPKYTSLNAQINASNSGFHTLENYKNINTIVINASELRHEMRQRDGNIVELGKTLQNRMKSEKIIITQGQSGAVLIAKKKYIIAPAFSNELVDKIGAGDTLLVLISLCLKAGFQDEVAIFVASVAAGMSTARFANSQTIDKNELLNRIKYYLK